MKIHSEPPGIPNKNTVAKTFETIIVINFENKDKLNICYNFFFG